MHSETPFAVGLGLQVHKETRSKKIINCLSDLGLSIDYDRVIKIETEISNSVTDIINKNNWVYVPHTILKDKAIHFAIDNTDFHNDTPDGKGEFDGIGQILFQKADSKAKTLENFNTTKQQWNINIIHLYIAFRVTKFHHLQNLFLISTVPMNVINYRYTKIWIKLWQLSR